MSLDPGSSVGPYRIVGEIGRGAMSIVYEAVQVDLGRSVALKVLNSSHHSTPEVVKRFELEAEAVGRLNHPNIVRVIDRGRSNDRHYIAMDLVRGTTLEHLIEDRLRSMEAGGLRFDRKHVEWAVGIAIDVLRGLAYAHENGVVHRDIKPQNILIGKDGRARIVDFGLARVNLGSGVTMTGQVLGTPSYLSPEQAQPGLYRLDHRTDVYSAGVTLYQMLALELPFTERDTEAVIHSIVHRTPPRLRGTNPHLPRDMEIIVLKAMEKAPDDRYSTAAAFADDLERFINFAEIHARPAGVARRLWRLVRRNATVTIAVAIAIAAVIATVWVLLNPSKVTFPLPILVEGGPATLTAYRYDHRSGGLGEPVRFGSTSTASERRVLDLEVGDYLLVAEGEGGPFGERFVIATMESEGEPEALIRVVSNDEVLAGMEEVPAGEYSIGSDTFNSSSPAHTQRLRGFWIDRDAATTRDVLQQLGTARRAQLEASSMRDGPVGTLNWAEAANYAASRGKRLPTEFELEAALRGAPAGSPAIRLTLETAVQMWCFARYVPYEGWPGKIEAQEHFGFSESSWVVRGLPRGMTKIEIDTGSYVMRQPVDRGRRFCGVRGVRSAAPYRPPR